MRLLPSTFKKKLPCSPRQQIPVTTHINKSKARFGSTDSLAAVTVRFIPVSGLRNASCSNFTSVWLCSSYIEKSLTNPYSTRKITMHMKINYTASINYLLVVTGAKN